MRLENKNLDELDFLPLIIVLSSIIFMSCDSTPKENLKVAEVVVANSKEKYEKSEKEFKQEIENYRIVTLDKIAVNDRKLIEFKEKAAKDKSIAASEFKRKIVELEEKNTALKNRVNAFVGGDKKNWEEFKAKCSKEAINLHGDICNICGPQK